MRIAILVSFISIALYCCSKDDGEPVTPVVKVYDTTGYFTHDGKTRTYRIHLPTSYYENTNKLPLVLGLHGGGGSGEQFEAQTGLSNKSNAADFIIVYPDGLTNPNATTVRTWNAGKCCGANASTLDTDDVGFISKLIDKMAIDYRVDSKLVYATGHSNGAMMCYRLANELSTKIAAIAPNAGNFQIKSPYAPTRNVPVIGIISKLDQNVKYLGGMTEGPGGQYNPPLDSCLNIVAGQAACTQSKQVVQSETLYTEYKWSGCSPETFEVVLYLTEDGGHSWPGGNKGSIVGDEPSKAFINNDIIWDFLSKYSLP
jgi:polyhydroxybutyrate depolymerase